MSPTDRDRRHAAFIKQRLVSDWGKAQLIANADAAVRRILATPVRELLDKDAIARLIEHASTDPVLSETVRPLVRASLLLSVARLREDPEKLGTYVSPEARALIDKLLEQPGMLPERFVKKMLAHGAFEEIARDVLDQALREFSEKVDPFKAEWGLPSLLKLGGPLSFGLGAFAKSFEAVRGELDKRLVPERKRFLQGFAKRALEMVGDFLIKKSDQPEFMALRKELFAWLLEQPVSELMSATQDKSSELFEKVGHELSRHVAHLPATQRRRRAQLDMIVQAHAHQTLEQALAVYGARPHFDASALVNAIWPLVIAALGTPESEAFFLELVSGFDDA